MSFDKHFLEDEVRLGFYIPATIKQAWAAELELLNIIDTICKKHSIKYFADWGTFLGAVRHGGFIPWDDDLDLVMLRDDYNKFISLAESEFPKGCSVHTFRNENDFIEFHAVVVNSDYARFDEEFFNAYHGFPYSCGIDIFVLDFIHKDDEIERLRCKDVLYIIAFADELLKGSYDSATVEHNLSKIEIMCNSIISRSLSTKELWIKLYELAELKCAEVSSLESDTITQMVPWGLKQQANRRYNISDYNVSTLLPFEDTFISVPMFYDLLLSKRYGNYMQPLKNAGAHDYPYFEKQKINLENLLGHKINHYDFPDLSAINLSDRRHDNWKNTIVECLSNLSDLYNKILLFDNNLLDNLCDSQDLSIELGNFIETIKGNTHPAIKSIETYCEALYSIFSYISGDNSNHYDKEILVSQNLTDIIKESYTKMTSVINAQILNKKEIVFLPSCASHWNKLYDCYNYYLNNKDYDVYVVAIPYYYKNYDGSLSDEQYNLSSYPEDINVIKYTDFSLVLHKPDIIVIDSPYDQYNAVTSIHPDYYSSKLYSLTDKLIYIPWFTTYDFDDIDIRAYKNMDYYVCVPGLIYADEIYLNSSKLKSTYIKKIKDWSNTNNDDYWDNKIQVVPNKLHTLFSSDKKTLLYYIGEGQPLQNYKYFIDKLNKNLQVICNYSELSVYIYLPNMLITNLKKYHPDLIYPLEQIIDSIKSFSNVTVINNITTVIINTCDAYYGDTSPVASEFLFKNKPVMIQNYIED